MISVITTINYPTEAVKKIAELSELIVVGDIRTPKDWKIGPIEPLYSTEFEINEFLPYSHYSRKNLGYLTAIYNKAKVIYDTDDDNVPNENWKERTVEVEASASMEGGWFNVYNVLSISNFWPRGFSLRHINKVSCAEGELKRSKSSIQQGLSNGEPDVDAIWRLILNKKNEFVVDWSIYLKPGAWCPFNSQSTWWFPKAYPLMYLPVTVSFRMTDIWRSFVAQRCLWEMGEGVTFHSPAEVFQDRNEHDLLKDFEQEIPGYLLNDKIVEILSGLTLNGDVFENLMACYKALENEQIVPMHEIRSVGAWIKDLQKIYENS